VLTSYVDTWRAVNFLTKNLIEVSIQSFLKIEVSSMMRIKI